MILSTKNVHRESPGSNSILGLDEAGDSKVTWELNRHQHFVTLAKAYHLSGDHRFANEIFDEWRHWHAENHLSHRNQLG